MESGLLIGQVSDPPIISSAKRRRHGAQVDGTGSIEARGRRLRNL